jgi:hypothetical protein
MRIALRLEPGEMVSVERWPGSLYLETFSSFLDAVGDLSGLELWQQVLRLFHKRTLTVVEERGGVPISMDLFPLRRRDHLILQVLFRGRFPELYLYPADLTGICREALERNR